MSAPAVDPPFVFSPDNAATATGDAANKVAKEVAAIERDCRISLTSLLRELNAAVGSSLSLATYDRRVVASVRDALSADGVTLVSWNIDPSTRTSANDDANVEVRVEADSMRIEAYAGVHIDAVNADARGDARRCIAEVVNESSPTVVPPPDSGSDLAMAVVPLYQPQRIDRVVALIVHLEPDQSAAAYRGILRFAVQVSDLAARFYAAEYLARLQIGRNFATRFDQFLADQSDSQPTTRIEAAADWIAERWEFSRVVCLRRNHADRLRLVAASHVDAIDADSSAAKSIEALATAMDVRDDIRGDDLAVLRQSDGKQFGVVRGGNESMVLFWPRVVDADTRDSNGASETTSHTGRIEQSDAVTALEATGSTEPVRVDAVADHVPPGTGQVLRRAAAWINETARGDTRRVTKQRSRPLLVVASIAMIAILMAWPMPQSYSASGYVVPEQYRNVYGPSDAVVDEVYVRHGQRVRVGDVLIELRDDALESRRLSLQTRRSGLITRSDELRRGLITDGNANASAELSAIEAELNALDDELAAVESSVGGLTIRAAREGIIDQPRIQTELAGRPIARGELLLTIVEDQSRWRAVLYVDAQQLPRIRDSDRAGSMRGRGHIEGSDDPISMDDVRFGPTAGQVRIDPVTGVARHPISLGLTAGDASFSRGTAFRGVLECGTTPMIRYLFGDAIDRFKREVATWI